MPVPKKRHSPSRQGKRRANWKLVTPNYNRCSECGAPVLPHHACLACGTYRGKKVLTIKEKKAKKEKS
jgi:large subunit ribosomal protein L32